ncbi:MAG: FAD-dependent oxidoreductase, partial [Acidobacteriota bacterium]
LDVTPRQLLGMGGRRLPRRFEKRLRRYRYGPGAFKLDYALDDPVPSNPLSRGAMLEYRGGRTIYITIPTRLPQKGGLAALKL